MIKLNRRNFIKSTSTAVVGLSVFGCSKNMMKSSGIIMPKFGKRVVVVGGGYGGATTAKYLKMIDPTIDVVLIEKNEKYVSCPMSNWVVGNILKMKDITLDYTNLANRYGIKVVIDTVMEIDAEKQFVYLKQGKIEYDRLVVSPGIQMDYSEIKGFDDMAKSKFVHAWKAGPETEQLSKEIAMLGRGENVLLSVPPAPYRCPPGPYERISLIASYIKNNKLGGKIIVIDPNDDVVSKGRLFKAAWKQYYEGILDYRPDTQLLSVDAGKNRVETTKGSIEAKVINIIPKQKAGELAFSSGLIPKGGRWAKVNAFTFESRVMKNIHVIGDASHTGTVGTVPKSGYVANSMGKVVAEALGAILNGKEPPRPFMANSCYSLVNHDEAMWVSAIYEYDDKTKRILKRNKAGGTPVTHQKVYKIHAWDWAQNIWSDTFG